MKSERYRFKCVLCGNCCSDKETFVNVTYIDILRLIRGLNLSLSEVLELLGFYIFADNLTDDELERMVISPIITERGKAFVGLLKHADGSCIFLKDNLCKIYNLRPTFCRTFPFSFKAVGLDSLITKVKIQMKFATKSLEYCKGISDDAPYIQNKKWIKLGKNITQELQDNVKFIEIWNMSIKKGKIKPTAKNFIKTVIKYDKKLKKSVLGS